MNVQYEINHRATKPLALWPDDCDTPQSVKLAKIVSRLDRTEFALARVVNALENSMPQLALTIALEALRSRPLTQPPILLTETETETNKPDNTSNSK